MSKALIFASTNPQYDNRLFIELPVRSECGPFYSSSPWFNIYLERMINCKNITFLSCLFFCISNFDEYLWCAFSSLVCIQKNVYSTDTWKAFSSNEPIQHVVLSFLLPKKPFHIHCTCEVAVLNEHDLYALV